jgi:hypothetical protein
MTEQEWMRCKNLGALLNFVKSRLHERRLRLLAVAWLRAVKYFDVWSQPDSRGAIDVTEKTADGLTTHAERLRAVNAAEMVAQTLSADMDEFGPDEYVEQPILFARACVQALSPPANETICDVLRILQSRGFNTYQGQPDYQLGVQQGTLNLALFRDIVGNPFRPVAIDPRWLTSTVLDLAAAIYDERAFDRMPILADSLMDAGCNSNEIIEHCRASGPHVRGCWVIDLLLDKS